MDKILNYTDVKYSNVPSDEECILNAVQLGKRIVEPPSTIRKWAEYYAEDLYIKKINGRFVYTELSVSQFRFVQELRSKNLTHKLIEDHIKKYGFKYPENGEGLIDSKDPLGFQVLASALTVEVENKLKNFAQLMYESMSNQLDEKLSQHHEQVTIAVEEIVGEVVADKLDSKLEEFQEVLIQTLDKREQEAKQRDVEMIDMLRKNQEDRAREVQIEEENKKGFFSRIFGKN